MIYVQYVHMILKDTRTNDPNRYAKRLACLKIHRSAWLWRGTTSSRRGHVMASWPSRKVAAQWWRELTIFMGINMGIEPTEMLIFYGIY